MSTITDVVRNIMAALPDVEEFLSHGSPNFRVRGRKVFATYTINHHGDGRVALNVMAPRGRPGRLRQTAAASLLRAALRRPLRLARHRARQRPRLVDRLRTRPRSIHAHRPRRVAALLAEKHSASHPPTRKFRPEEIDPFQGKAAQALLKKLDAILLPLPATTRGTRFGSPTWQAGTKVFATAHYFTGRLKLSFWVGPTRQRALKKDKRFEVSQYTGHNGWIDLDVEDEQDWPEITALALESYRHFALQRMLKLLDKN